MQNRILDSRSRGYGLRKRGRNQHGTSSETFQLRERVENSSISRTTYIQDTEIDRFLFFNMNPRVENITDMKYKDELQHVHNVRTNAKY